MNKFIIDKLTKNGAKNETEEQRIERLEKRISWNLDLKEDDKKFFDLYTQAKSQRQPIQKYSAEYYKSDEYKQFCKERKEKYREINGTKEEIHPYQKEISKENELDLYPIKDFYLLSDDEIIAKLNELTDPIYPILNEIKIKEKDWMPDEEKQDYGGLKNQVLGDSLFDDEDLDEFISGFRKYDDKDFEDEEDELEIDDYISSLSTKIDFNNYVSTSDFEFVNRNRNLLKDIEFEFIRIFWSSFDIDEDLLDVVFFWEKYPQYSSDGEPTKEQKDAYQRYQKAYFYSKDKVIRAAKIFKRFEKQKRAKLNSKIIPKKIKIEENLTEVGFVYFIRNKDIYKIGITQNMLQRMDQLKPDELLDSIRCSNYKELEREIHSQFKGCRIPQTEYFRLDKEEINQIHQILKDKAL